MGRHGSGGSESEYQRGADQTDPRASWSWSEEAVSTGAFWPAERPDPQQPAPQPAPQPAWPQPPDRPAVTGQWARPAPEQPYHLPPQESRHQAHQQGPRQGEESAEVPWDQRASFNAPPPEPGDVKVAGAPVPAWAETQTAFLGSGWSNDDSGWSGGEELPDDEGRRRGRRRPRSGGRPPGGAQGRGKAALLAVAAVAVVLGGSVVGVRMMSSSAPAECTGDSCQAASGQPMPTVSDSGAADESPQTEADQTPESEESPTARTPGRTTTPRPARPTPTKSRLKQTQRPVSEPSPDFPDASPTAEPTSTEEEDAPIFQDDPGADSRPTVEPTTDTFGRQSSSQVGVTFDLLEQGRRGYTAEVSVTNHTGTPLSAATVTVPVSGDVFDVAGANWTQDGDLLILDLPGELPEGGQATVTVSAYGQAEEPETCGVVGAECVMG
ncbi:hypothetical protein GCM10022248_49330 [Nonomuraea soli]